MNSLTILANQVKECVSAIDVAQALGLEVNRHGRCRCPAHNGKDFNCKLFPGNRGWYCYVCHEGGDIFSLARANMGEMPFADSLRWFNETFNLGLDIDAPMDQKALKRAQEVQEMQRKIREVRKLLNRMRQGRYLACDLILEYLEARRDRLAACEDGVWSDAFAAVIRMIPVIKRIAEKSQSIFEEGQR